MSKLAVIKKTEASEESRQIFENIERSIGMLPNIYAVFGNSANALSAYLTFSEQLKKSNFNAKEREAIFLAVSEANGCNYCLAAHTALGKMNGFTEGETFELRKGIINDKRLNVLTNLAKSIVENRGKADESIVDSFFALGYDSEDLVDFVGLVIEKTYTNYIGRLAKPEIDFPAAIELEKIDEIGG